MGIRARGDDVEALRRNVERALGRVEGAGDVAPMLVELARSAEPGSGAWLLAHRHLAELAVDRDPWRASVLARRVVAVDSRNDAAWAVLALAQTLLGNYRFAARAYQRAVALSPENPWYAHNLGHLMDVALGRPADAIELLRAAHRAEPRRTEIAASYVHALARAGRVAEARRVFRRAIGKTPTGEHEALWRWLEAGAPVGRSRRRPGTLRAPRSDSPRRRSRREG